MRRGGLLEGLAPAAVVKLTLLTTLLSVIVIAAGVGGLLIEIGQHDLFLGIVIVVLGTGVAAIASSVTGPALRAARSDRKQPARTVQGQLVGASPISPTPSLALVALNVGRNVEQFRVRRELFERTKGGATVVGLTVTPGLNYVQTLTVIRRERAAVMRDPEISRTLRMSVWLPILSIAAMAIALALGGLIGAFLPLGRSITHPIATLVLALILAGGVALFTRWYGQKLVAQLGV